MLLSLFSVFFRIGLFTFGGGYAMIAQIREEIVEKRKWLTEGELTEIIAIAESTPGPLAINLATYVGYKHGKVRGSLAATVGVVIPSLVILYLISLFLDSFMENRYVAYAFTGIKCAVAFLILKAGLDMLPTLERRPVPLILFFTVFLLMILFELFSVTFSSLLFILGGGLIGMLLCAVGRRGEGRK